MSSSAQFSHGLNNWDGSDKPTRTDFVTDNRLVDEGALWKAEFDPKANAGDETGPVEAAGGIAAYAMAKADYDADGTIAEAGGIGEFVEGLMNDEMMTKSAYAPDATAEMADGVLTVTSTHTHPETSYAVEFDMPDGYEPSSSLVLDGASVSVTGADGEAVELDVAPGVPVFLARRGDLVFPKMGGSSVTYTNENGTAQKFSDGTLICYKSSTVTTGISIATTSLYYSGVTPLNIGNWAIPFVGAPFYQNTTLITDPLVWKYDIPTGYDPETEIRSFRLVSNSIRTAQTYAIEAYAIGRWK